MIIDQGSDLGAPGRIRTCDTRFRKPLLYPLSYEGASSQNTRQRWVAIDGAR